MRVLAKPYDESLHGLFVRWAIGGTCITALHFGAVYAAMYWPHQQPTTQEAPAAIMIELAPLPVAPEAPPQEVAVGPQMVTSQPSAPPQPEPLKQTEVPPLPENPSAAAVLPAAEPETKKEKPKEEKKKPPEKEKEKKKEHSRPAPVTSAPKAARVPRARTNAAPAAGASSSMSVATWRSALMAHLNRYKRFPAGGTRGTSLVTFSIDGRGNVVSARLARSSGDSVLDREAVSLARRASPVPPPPSNIAARGRITLRVPIRFN
jgi:protein TonB